MTETNKIAAEIRTEFGKGASRRARRDWKVPTVLYGHGTDPQHFLLHSQEFAAILRKDGTNAVLDLQVEGKSQLALVKQVVLHPLRDYIEHADLLVIKKGEKVVVDVPVVLEDEAAGGTLVTQEATHVEVEADALNIPEQIVHSIFNLEAGTQVTAADLTVPAGATVVSDPETLIVNVIEAPREADLDEGTDAEAPAEDEPAAE
ncbi:50S ribosomal protein L25/general stress protein Ctc [Tsukamurella sp. 8F]|uniref:50S ribosomal protein L25/general stress protein Ctc n=1 Tax=unclassified Tsukamurella TaxID=2633480 RepID=UPI0023B94B6E|nr:MULTISPECIES: 50S ribosomal protein L25/general stress protein Ctc [unclassified Tsukamurella]MDF0530252.1 50S ribosomal protein L25/general stress protein Ctc [Tsukamurella sp. 8J]MDF0586569.1 50S ribosomal protein L25/general stress protein Ctc [Tsukamurella sp. 8F]